MAVNVTEYRQRGRRVMGAFGLGAIHPYSILQGVGQRVKLILSFWGLTLIIAKAETDLK